MFERREKKEINFKERQEWLTKYIKDNITHEKYDCLVVVSGGKDSHMIVKRLVENHGSWYYEQQELGYNYRLTDIQAALGSSQMDKIDDFIARRRQIARQYNKAFQLIEEIITPHEPDYSNSGWHIYVIQIKADKLNGSRKDIFDALQAENIGVNVHYLPVYLHPYYQKLGYKRGLCPNAEALYENMITLPIHPSMTDGDVEIVITALNKVISYYKD